MIVIPHYQKAHDFATAYIEKNNMGQRGKFDGNKKNQLVGAYGETILRKIFKYPQMESDGFDGGYDMLIDGMKIDVKTMARRVEVSNRYDYVNNLVAPQLAFDCDMYIFTSLNTDEKSKNYFNLTICGWIPKKDFIKLAVSNGEGSQRTRDDGTSFSLKANQYEIKNSDLYESDTIDQLVWAMNNYPRHKLKEN